MALDIWTRGRTIEIGGSWDWPPPPEAHRLNTYMDGRNLFRGNHQFVFVRSGQYTIDLSRPYLTINLCGAATRLLVGRAMAEQAIAIPGTPAVADWLDELMERSDLGQRSALACAGASYRGDAVFKIRWDPAVGDSVISTVDPSQCVVHTDPMDINAIVGVDIGQMLTDGKNPYLFLERYALTGGTVILTNELYHAKRNMAQDTYDVKWDDPVPLSTLPATANLPDTIDIQITRIPIVWIANMRDEECGIYGISDYDELESIQGEINNRYTNRSAILDKFTDPVVVGPRELMDENGDVELGSNNKYISTGVGEKAGEVMAYVTWDASLAAVERTIQDLQMAFATVAGIDAAALLEMSGATVPASGRAIKLGQARTQSRVHQKQQYMEAALQQTISIASEMSARWGSTSPVSVVPVEDVVVTYTDGLPTDEQEGIEQQILMLDAQIQSRQRAIMDLHGMSEDEADTLIEQIDGEQPEPAEVPSSMILSEDSNEQMMDNTRQGIMEAYDGRADAGPAD